MIEGLSYSFSLRPPKAHLAYDGARFEISAEFSLDEFMFTFAAGKTYTALVLALALGPLSLDLRWDLFPGDIVPFEPNV